MASSITHPTSFMWSTPLAVTRKTQPYIFRPTRLSVSAAKGDAMGGRMVDENMIVLRKRIHEMKVEERSYEPPSEWMDWEKKYYVSYNAFICEWMRVLQSGLMNTRPSLALGMMVLIASSVPVSSFVVVSNAIEIGKGVLNGIL
ncbi:uncharacterized protein LOC112525984 [Cynara cardunculus var. scolymus]|uniref:uncharacterized protein LOC112525984 n=1 Tax=Cynara cardunculus var. scolymus TaxID=59895 RepID=UPI000D62C2C8|nr:uncharacterized protein LOC112525984 [Cynara cardunculus var. scolymus]